MGFFRGVGFLDEAFGFARGELLDCLLEGGEVGFIEVLTSVASVNHLGSSEQIKVSPPGQPTTRNDRGSPLLRKPQTRRPPNPNLTPGARHDAHFPREPLRRGGGLLLAVGPVGACLGGGVLREVRGDLGGAVVGRRGHFLLMRCGGEQDALGGRLEELELRGGSGFQRAEIDFC